MINFKNLIILIKNINNYGFFIFILSAFYELFYSIKFNDFKIFNYDLKKTNNYHYTKNHETYSTPNISTPYYLLNIVKIFLKKNNIKKFNLHDFGCGNGRVGSYLNIYFDINFIGIDLDQNLIKQNKKKYSEVKNFYFYHKNLQDIAKANDLSFFLKNEENRHRDYLLFCSDPFDSKSILKLIYNYKKMINSFYFLMINQKNISSFKNFKIINQIFFKNSKRNITLFKL